MENSKQRKVDLALDIGHDDEAPVDEPEFPVVGSITITFRDAHGHIVPEVSFRPLGRINPNTIERYLPHIYQEIQREQVKERRDG